MLLISHANIQWTIDNDGNKKQQNEIGIIKLFEDS